MGTAPLSARDRAIVAASNLAQAEGTCRPFADMSIEQARAKIRQDLAAQDYVDGFAPNEYTVRCDAARLVLRESKHEAARSGAAVLLGLAWSVWSLSYRHRAGLHLTRAVASVRAVLRELDDLDRTMAADKALAPFECEVPDAATVAALNALVERGLAWALPPRSPEPEAPKKRGLLARLAS
jgi:hypothetical protein